VQFVAGFACAPTTNTQEGDYQVLTIKEMVDVNSETKFQILIECPATGKPAQKLAEIFVDIPNGQANW